MTLTSDSLTHADTAQDRFVGSLDEVATRVAALKAAGNAVVLTSGSFDLIHLGHVKYLSKAKAFGDVLIVGVDSDAKIRQRKGPGRPMVPESERLELLAHQRPVDLVYLKDEADARWALVRSVAPDVLVVSEDHGYSPEEEEELGAFCGRIEVLDRQASVTTSERIRQMYMHMGAELGPGLADELSSTVRSTLDEVLPELIDRILQRR